MKKENEKPDGEKPKEKKKRGKYDESLAVKGSFLDLIGAAVKNANDKRGKKKE